MHPSAVIPILQSLADGLDPATGQPFPSDSPYQQADTVRALHAALEALRAPASPAQAIGASPSEPRLPRPVDPDKPTAGQKCTPEEDQRLRDGFLAHASIAELAATHGRTRGAITSRLVRLRLLAPTAAPPNSGPAPAVAPFHINPKPDETFPF